MATLPNPNPLTNNAVANYQYFVDPTTTIPNTGANISNDVSTFINVADAQITKYVSNDYVGVGAQMFYTLVVKNLGNTTANNVILTDTTPNGTTFVSDSLTINTVPQPGFVIDPPAGATIGNINPNGTVTVTWFILVNTIPSPNPIPNTGTNNYSFVVDPVAGTSQNTGNNSNLVNTQVNNANLANAYKYANPTSGKVGDVIEYKIVIPNNGNVTANFVYLQDTIPNFTTFVPNSVFVNNVNQPGLNPNPPGSVPVGAIGIGQTSTVTFNVTLTALPTVNPIPNQASLSYLFSVSPSVPNAASNSAITNVANVFTNQAVIDNTNGGGLTKAVNQAFAKVGDILTYTIALNNTGNVTAENVVLTDTIPNGTSFVSGSVFVNGSPFIGGDPQAGIAVGSIVPGTPAVVVFQVTVLTIPTVNPIPNNSTVNFDYTQDPANPNGVSGSGNSNTVNTRVNQATIDNGNGGGLTKGVNTNYAKVGDILTYTIGLKNTGNVPAANVVFTDTIPNDTTFVTNSVTVNSVPQTGATPVPGTGVNVGTIPAGSITTITFNVVVNTIPNPNPIPNNGTVNYNYTIDPSLPNGGAGSGNTNTVNTQVNQATIDNTNGGGLVKAVDKAFAKVGDVLTYTINLTNTGNVTANAVTITDTTPNGTIFVPNTITLNGAPQTGATIAPPTGFNAGSIAPGATSIVTYNVVVTTIPNPNPIPNSATVRYTFTQIPTVPNGASGSGNSNTVNTQVNTASIDNATGGLTKFRDKAFADVGDVINYTVVLKNVGNTAANNVVFTDTTPNGTTFVTDSVFLNAVNQPGIVLDPPTGLTVGTIAAGGVSTITYQVTVNTIPNPNPIPNSGTVNFAYTLDPASPDGQAASGNTNIVTTQVNSGNFNNGAGGITKLVNTANAKIGDQLTYTIVLTNTGNATNNNIVFTDTIPNGTTFVANSFRINNVTQTGANPAPPTGVSIGSIAPGATTTLLFNVTVTQVPVPNPIPNVGKVSYNYTVDPAIPNGKAAQNLTNTVNTTVSQATIDNTNGGGMTKAVSSAFAMVGDILTYTIALNNTGNVTANNVVLTDTIPAGTSFVSGSVFVNGNPFIGGNPQTGIAVGSIAPGIPSTVVFQVTVTTIPTPNPIPNNSTVNFNYTIDPAFPDGQSGSGNSNQVTTQVNQATINNTVGGGLNKFVNPNFAKVGDTILYTVVLRNTGNVQANNVQFSDTIPNNTSFVAGSVRVNNIPQASFNPTPPGFTVGSIAAGASTTVVFNVVINTIPSPNPIPNTATAVYNFTVDPARPNSVTASGNTNFVNTQVNQAIINNATGGLVKSVDKLFAAVGEVITYTIAVNNTGNTSANNIKITDTIPAGTTFIANSVYLNGVNQPGVSPVAPTGIAVGTVGALNVSTVTFQVVINTIPTPNPIPNTATSTFTYTIDPSVPNGGSGSGNSNLVNTQVNQATIDNTNGGGLVKSVDKAYADVGDVLNYTIVLKNTGNVQANNIILTDTTPTGTSIVSGSIVLNGITQPISDLQSPGLTVGSIAAGGVATVTFQATVLTIPTPNPIPNNGTVTYTYTTDPALPDGRIGSGNTNTVNTQVNSGNFANGAGGISKLVNTANAKVGDQLTYTIVLTNTGNVASNNIVFTDTIPSGTTFVANSFKVNNVVQPGANPAPPLGVNIGTINPGATSTIVFNVTVSQIPVPNPIPNSGKVSYNYTVNPAIPNGKAAQNLTNIVNTTVSQATIDYNNGGGMTKAVNYAFAQVGQILTYTIALNNTGNVTADNVVLTDTIPNGTSFVSNSVFVNGVNQPGSNPAPGAGVNVGAIGPNNPTIVTFQVTVITVPTPNPIPNNSTVNYQYTIDPAFPDGQSGSGNSNQVTTQVNQATIDNTNGGGLVKYVSQNYGKVGDVVTYTIVLKNTGNTAANSVTLIDTIPNNTSFVNNSVFLNGINQLGANPAPPSGFVVGSIAPLTASTVTFKVVINTIPNPNPIPNNGTVNYSFTINPANPNGGSGSGNTNTVNTQVNQATIDNTNGGGLVKSVDKVFAAVNDILTYSISLTNTGNTAANNVVMTDTIPSGTTFITNSVFVNGTNQPGANPAPGAGVTVGTIAPLASSVVTFQVRVNTIPNPNPIPNNSTVNYRYTIDPSVPNGASSSGNSNLVTTQINQATIDNTNGGGLVKSVDKAYADVGDVLNYTIVLKNTGNVAANNIAFTDTIPTGTTFVANSVILNGINQGAVNPGSPTGVPVGTITAGSSATITFQVTVNTIPIPNPIPNNGTVNYTFTADPSVPNGRAGSGNTNTVTTQVNSGNFNNQPGGANKSVNKSFAKVNDVITYTIALTNTGNATNNNVVVTDTIPTGTTFISNSVFVNGTNQLGATVAPPTGINVGSIAPLTTTTILFQVIVNTIPTPNPIPNQAKASYTYTVNPAFPNGKAAQNLTNIPTTQVNQATIDNTNGSGLGKSVDKAYAKVGDVINYTITLGNTGNVAADNVVFTDTIPAGTQFVSGSVYVDNVNQPGANPAPGQGVTITSIPPQGASTITFQVTVITIPTPNPIPNNGTVNYRFTLDPAVPDGATGAGNTNKVTTQVNTAIIDNNGVNGNGMNKIVDKAFAAVGDTVLYTVVLKNTGNVAANNVIFTDTIPNGGVYVPNTFRVNGILQPGANPIPPTGVNVGTINAGQALTLTFNATVASIPNPNPMVNNSTTNYTYTLDPAIPNGQAASGNSNAVNTQVNGGFDPNNGGLNKGVDKAYAQINDVLTYTITIFNNGNTTLGNILIKDTIPTGTTFNVNSVSIDGTPKPGFNPQVGIGIPTLATGITTTIKFNVTVIGTIPTPNPILNNNVMTYTYTVDPAFPNGRSGGGISNTVNTQINSAIMNSANGGLIKTVSKAYADVGDVLNYTIFMRNTGNTAANNILVTDTIPNDTSFIINSVMVNGAFQPGTDPVTGINITTLAPGQTATIMFQVSVNTIPNPNPIPNSALANYQYTIDPAIPNGGSAKNLTNTVNTQVNSANFNGANGQGGIVKYVDKAYAQVGEVLRYTVRLQNTGNTTANNIIFKDTIPSGTNFVNNSVAINGAPQGSNPATGVTIPNIAPLQVVTVSFNVLVNTLPTINPLVNNAFIGFTYTTDPAQPNAKASGAISNNVSTQVNQATIDNNNGSGLGKSRDLAFAKVGDVITYTITLGNTGNVAADNVVFTDTIPSGTSFVTNSVFVDTVNQPGANPAPSQGVTISTIPPQGASTITFQVMVMTIPTPNPIPNSGTVKYQFTKDPAAPDGAAGSGNTNRVTTQVNYASIDNGGVGGNGLNKSVAPMQAAVGDILTYTIIAKNTGNVVANNVVITDTIPNGTTFVSNSVTLNSVAQPGVDPEVGIPVGNLNPLGVATITFRVRVGQTIPNPNPIPNNATSTFTYTVDPANPNGVNGGGNSNTANAVVNSAIINNSTGGGLVKAVSQAFAKTKDILQYTVSVGNTGNVTANNVVVADTIPTGTTFVLNSVFVNGIQQPAINPQNGISIANIAPGGITTITFNVQIGATVPSPNPIPNDARANYTFTVIPTIPNGRSGAGISNKVITQVNSAIIDNGDGGGATKTGSPSNADIGDIVTFTIGLKNTGNVPANNVVITDTIPNGTTFVNNSVTLNQIPQTGANVAPPTGFNIGTLNPGGSATVTFQVLVVTVPNPNPIINTATTSYTFTQDPSVPDGAKGGGNTNGTPVQVNNGGLNPAQGGFSKLASNAFAAVGDVVTYTINFKNTGNVSITSVVIKDTIPSGTNFVLNSVTLNGVSQPGVNPQSGVSVGTLAPAQGGVIAFNVVVNTIPTPNPIPNNAVGTYNYTVVPTVPNGKAGGNITNTVTTQVNQATIDNANGGGLKKFVNKVFSEVGDTLNYTIVLTNTGNVAANNVQVTDTVPNGTVYVPGTATVNGIPVSITSPTTGIPVGIINAGMTSTVTFTVSVVSLPSPNPIPNAATSAYSFIVDPINQISRNATGNSNIVSTQINEAVIDNTVGGGFTKSVDLAFVDIGDVITYTIGAKNTGNVSADNVVITDTIPNGTTFNTGSVFVNGVPNSGANPQAGINIGSVPASGATTIVFKVTVVSVPTPNPILNSATAKYNFTIDPSNPDSASASGNTNIVNTQVNNASFNPSAGGMTKYTSINYGQVGDTIVYTTALTNTGSVLASNIVFIDTIPLGTTFVGNSVVVNGAVQPGSNPQTGVILPAIAPGVVSTVQFSVTVTTLPTLNPIPNRSNVTYSYIVNPSQPGGKNGSNLSNQVTTQINDPNITPANGGLVKTSSKQYATLGDIITYTVAVKNVGNTAADGVIIQDTIPVGTAFIPGTVTINGSQQAAANPQAGVSVGSILPGQSVTMAFNVVVTTIPLVNPIPNQANLAYNFTKDPSIPNGASSSVNSNITATQINAAIIDNNFGGGLNKKVDLDYADIGYVLTYSFDVKNTGNVTATNVIINDTIPSGTTLVGNSVVVNGVAKPGVNPQSGITVGTIAPNTTSTVSFKVTVATIPSPNPIPNSAVSTYSFIVNPTNPVPTTVKGLSNIVNTQVNNGNIDFNKGGGFVKSVDKVFAKIGDIITYTLNLKNTGNATVNNVVVVDTLPNGTAFVQGSATVNGTPVGITNPGAGIPVGTIGPSQTSTVVYSVVVTQIPTPNPIPNTASTKYTYTVNPANPNGVTGGGNSNTVTTALSQAIIDGASGGLTKTADKQFADVGDTITYTIVAKNTGTVTANNVIISDTIPNGTALIPGSVTLNGVTQGSANPATGINIGSLAANQVATITFKVTVTAVPTTNPIPNAATANFTYTEDPANPNGASGSGNSNITTSQINHGEISNVSGGFIKTVTDSCPCFNSKITYVLAIKNTGNVVVNNVVISDTIPNATTFVPNSVSVNGTTFSGVNPQTGINLNSILPGGSVTVTFQVQITSIPASANTTNTAIAKYAYTVNPNSPNGVVASNSSNTVTTPINAAIIEKSGFTKAVDKSYADLGSILTYTLRLTNTGNTNATNVTVYDTLPNGTTFVAGSVTINGSSDSTSDPSTGIPIGVVSPGTTVTVTYQAQVTTAGIPIPNPLPNNADVTFGYQSC